MIPGHALTHYARSKVLPNGERITLPMHDAHRFECSCGWKRSGDRIGVLRLAYRRHLYDVTPKMGEVIHP